MYKGYLATNFFSEAGFEWTAKVAKVIRETGIDLYVPQENGEINDKDAEGAADVTAQDIALGDNKYLKQANFLIANLDGVEIDSGVSAEIGYFSGLMEAEATFAVMPSPRVIIGIYTDIRRDGEGDNRFYINLYTKGLTLLNGMIVNSTQELKEVLEREIKLLNRGF